MLVISVRELWLPPSRGPHIHHVYLRILSHGHEYARARQSPRVSRDDGGRVYAKLREMRSASGEKFRTKENQRKKNVRAITHSLDVGKWDSFGQLDLLFLPCRQQVLYAERTNLFPLAKKKTGRRCILSWYKKRRIKNQEINANMFYILWKHTSCTRLACFLRKLVESFFAGSRASCTCLNVPSSRHAARSFSTKRSIKIPQHQDFCYLVI